MADNIKMWQGARVFKNWFFHPFHWPWPVIAVIFGIYLVLTGGVFLLHKKEQKDKSHDLYYRALDIRKRELTNLKLSGTEIYVWKPLFECKGLDFTGPSGLEPKKQAIQPEGSSAQKTPALPQKTNSSTGVGSSAKTPASGEGVHDPTAQGVASGKEPSQSPGFAQKAAAQYECIQTAFSFTSNEEKMGYRPAKEGGVLYTGEIAQPCLICHPQKEGHTVTWSFHYPYVEPETAATELWNSDDFTYFHLLFWLIALSYGLTRWFSHRSGQGDQFAAAIKVDSNGLLDDWLNTKEGKKFYRSFFYAEHGPEYLRGYIPRKRFEALMKKIMSGEIPVEASSLRVGVVEYGGGELSFEGLRVAQALANKAPAGTLVIEENILPPAHEIGALKKAIWKKGNTPVYFRIVEL